jgi:hypothetical protein
MKSKKQLSGVVKKTTKTLEQFMSWQRSVLEISEYKTEKLSLESVGLLLRLLSYKCMTSLQEISLTLHKKRKVNL